MSAPYLKALTMYDQDAAGRAAVVRSPTVFIELNADTRGRPLLVDVRRQRKTVCCASSLAAE